MPALRGAVVGYGFIAERGHVPAYRERSADQRAFDIVAVADICEARRAAAKKALPQARIYSSALELLAAERGMVDFIDVSTPPSVHADIAMVALDRGYHVLCEKPLAARADDARALLAKARTAKRVLYPCHNYKHAPVIRAVERVLASGEIGALHLVTLDTYRTTHARGVAEWRPDWRRDRRVAGGGIAMDHGAHTFYLAMQWLRSRPSSVTASMSARGPSTTEDDASFRVSFPNGTVHARLTWNAGMRKVIYTLHGERGAVRVEDDELEITTLNANGKHVSRRESVASDWMDASHVRWFQPLQDDFAAAIDRHDYAGKEAQSALACVELIAAAYTSAQRGSREVALPGETRQVVEPRSEEYAS